MSKPIDILTVANVRKRFDQLVAVDGLSFAVGPGELVGLVGPNGAGKSTTLAMLCGELLPDEGTVTVGGHDVAQAPLNARRALGYVPQRLRLFPFLTGRELLELVATLKDVEHSEATARSQELLARLELDGAADRLVREYSEGMARKLAVAAALLDRPPLLLLDESLSGLDPRAAHALKAMLRDHVAEGGTVVLASHQLEVMERLCTRILLVHRGQLLDELDTDDLRALRGEGRSLEDHFLTQTAHDGA